MMGENTCQNDNNDWSLLVFHRTTSDKRQATGQLQQSDKQT